MKKKKIILISLIYILFNFINLNPAQAEKIVYIDMDKIMQISKAGKQAISLLA